MSQDLINRYQNSLRLQFQSPVTEAGFRETLPARARKASGYAFAVLLLLTLVFAYLEYRAFGHEIPMPMYGYLLAAALAAANLLLNLFSTGTHYQAMRLLGTAVLAMGTVIGAVYLQKYSAYHVIEFVLLATWLGSLRAIRVIFTLSVNLLLAILFVGVMYLTAISGFWIALVAALLISAVLLAGFIGYLTERAQRQLFLHSNLNDSMINRQELWAFTLIDLDMALAGIHDFKELIGLLKKYLEPVIEFDSYILTSLEGQGPKPVPDKVEGALFENEDKTLWSEDLLGKLTQTREATISAEHENVKGLLGGSKKRFTSYRLDVPVFNESKLMGVISLRRASMPFDELDKVASVSIAAQAMLIFKRSVGAAAAQASASQSAARARKSDTTTATTATTSTNSSPLAEYKDLEVTDHSFPESDQTLAPKDVVSRFKQESSKRTITLLSRENADKVAVDRYRTAAVEGEPLSILIIEVDGLSKMREQDGDQVAYKVFAAIVKYIFTKVDKEKDILGRYGQNGLSVLMPRVDMNAAEKFAEMIRQFVANARYKTAYGEKSATLSIGVAAITDDTGDYNSMVKRADMALFVAKKNGRNCVKVRL